VPLFATDTLEIHTIDAHPGFKKRMQWFVDNRKDLTEGLAPMTECGIGERRLLSVLNRPRLERILQRLFDEAEFLSSFGIRSLSRYHKDHPYTLALDGASFSVGYEPGESTSGTFGGNSNWRGPVWFPMNFLIIEALQRLHHYYGASLTVEFPTRSGRKIDLRQAAQELSRRLSALFLPDANGHRPVYANDKLFQEDASFHNHVLFHEFFHRDTGQRIGSESPDWLDRPCRKTSTAKRSSGKVARPL
jgi:hypothetical protein